MKNVKMALFLFTNILLILFCFTNCVKKKKKEDTPLINAPSQIVNIEQAKKMYEEYGERRVPLIQRYEDSINRRKGNYKIKQKNRDINDPKPFDVARFIYYDYKTIKQYIAYIEQEAKAADVEISTLRFYFSNYPDQEFFTGTKDLIKHPRQSSVMLSPTIKKGDRDYLFYIDDTSQEKPKAILLDDKFSFTKGNEMGATSTKGEKTHASFLPITKKSTTTILPFEGPKSLTMNRGHGSPPY